MHLTSKTFLPILTMTLLLSLSTFSWAKDTITLKSAWIADAPPNSSMHAGYLSIKNSGDDSIDLLTVSSPKFQTIEIHQTTVINNIARMVEQDGLPIFEKETTVFSPGGLHLMMMKPKGKIKLGDKIKLTLKFENNLTKTIIAVVQKRK